MKKLIPLLALVFLSLPLAAKPKEKLRYPYVRGAIGKVELLETQIQVISREPHVSEKPKLLKKGMSLKDKALFRVGEKSALWLMLSETSSVMVGDNSEVVIPEIAWENGAVSSVELLAGQMRYICSVDCKRKVFAEIFEVEPMDGDYSFEYDPKVPMIRASVLALGSLPFRGLENEKTLSLAVGESAVFTGEMENEKPAFDVLLRGRKVAKGKLGEKEKLSAEASSYWQKKEQDFLKGEKKAAPQVKRKPSQICDQPFGELNQCAWVCENNKAGARDCKVQEGARCIRMRCNANGEWSDRQEMPATRSSVCQAVSHVSTCDY